MDEQLLLRSGQVRSTFYRISEEMVSKDKGVDGGKTITHFILGGQAAIWALISHEHLDLQTGAA